MAEQDNQVTVEIDGISLTARPGQMLIDVADENGIAIPRFCYHKKLSVSANCRMCLVDVENSPKLMPACATPVSDGMKVQTRSARGLEAQKSVMEFLLINHPLDCPVCDQGGECDLQEIALGYGDDSARYEEKKRIVKEKNYGSLVATEMTRCIHCTRCVRFGKEIAGVVELGGTGRGGHMEIGTYVEKSLSSELSGNIIDICPVGALLSKPFLYQARSWELQQRAGIAAHDALGSHITIQTRNGKVMRVLPRENEELNEIWLSDRDRFSYLGLEEGRALTPLMRDRWSGKLVETDWDTALNAVVEGLRKVINQHGAEAIGALVSPSRTVEELFLLQKWVRGLGSSNIDHRLRQNDFSEQGLQQPLQLETKVAELEKLDAFLVIGSNIRHEQPLIAHRLRKAVLNQDAKALVLNPVEFDFNFPLMAEKTAENLVMDLAGIAKALLDKGQDSAELSGLPALVASAPVEDFHQQSADALLAAENAAIVLGQLAYSSENRGVIHALAEAIAELSGASFNVLTEGANAQGGWFAGALPDRSAGGAILEDGNSGLNKQEMLSTDTIKGLVMMGIEPRFDCSEGKEAITRLKKGCDFIVSLSSFRSKDKVSDVVLPVGAFFETSGTLINVQGDWQSFEGAIAPPGEARPAWKVLRVLGNLFGLDGFGYIDSSQILDELRAICGKVESSEENEAEKKWNCPTSLDVKQESVNPVPIYGVDALVRRSEVLQQTPLGKMGQQG